ncbi:hypothetical protein J6590_037221 [Homalodisca vitripennis]|nr:hypothetical protein J6590_037221 [Homalodisca vitripennis]
MNGAEPGRSEVHRLNNMGPNNYPVEHHVAALISHSPVLSPPLEPSMGAEPYRDWLKLNQSAINMAPLSQAANSLII